MKRRKGGLSVDKWECIAENLQKARKKCGYSYQKLADKTGLSKSTLQRYESGAIRSLPLEKAEQLAQALNITPAELLGWHERKQYKELGGLDRLRELVTADKEGRCVVLPCRIGDPVYIIRWHIGSAAMGDETYRFVDSLPARFGVEMLGDFGKTVFRSHKEASDALRKMDLRGENSNGSEKA